MFGNMLPTKNDSLSGQRRLYNKGIVVQAQPGAIVGVSFVKSSKKISPCGAIPTVTRMAAFVSRNAESVLLVNGC